MMQTAIRLETLNRDFGTVRAVDGLSLEVPSGIIFGFLGPNGAGKTTTINLLLGLLEPTSGTAEVLGFDTRTRADEVRAIVGRQVGVGIVEETAFRAFLLYAPARVWGHIEAWSDSRHSLPGSRG
jgi:ABC-2 type transport system ATP-binding protein